MGIFDNVLSDLQESSNAYAEKVAAINAAKTKKEELLSKDLPDTVDHFLKLFPKATEEDVANYRILKSEQLKAQQEAHKNWQYDSTASDYLKDTAVNLAGKGTIALGQTAFGLADIASRRLNPINPLVEALNKYAGTALPSIPGLREATDALEITPNFEESKAFFNQFLSEETLAQQTNANRAKQLLDLDKPERLLNYQAEGMGENEIAAREFALEAGAGFKDYFIDNPLAGLAIVAESIPNTLVGAAIGNKLGNALLPSKAALNKAREAAFGRAIIDGATPDEAIKKAIIATTQDVSKYKELGTLAYIGASEGIPSGDELRSKLKEKTPEELMDYASFKKQAEFTLNVKTPEELEEALKTDKGKIFLNDWINDAADTATAINALAAAGISKATGASKTESRLFDKAAKQSLIGKVVDTTVKKPASEASEEFLQGASGKVAQNLTESLYGNATPLLKDAGYEAGIGLGAGPGGLVGAKALSVPVGIATGTAATAKAGYDTVKAYRQDKKTNPETIERDQTKAGEKLLAKHTNTPITNITDKSSIEEKLAIKLAKINIPTEETAKKTYIEDVRADVNALRQQFLDKVIEAKATPKTDPKYDTVQNEMLNLSSKFSFYKNKFLTMVEQQGITLEPVVKPMDKQQADIELSKPKTDKPVDVYTTVFNSGNDTEADTTPDPEDAPIGNILDIFSNVLNGEVKADNPVLSKYQSKLEKALSLPNMSEAHKRVFQGLLDFVKAGSKLAISSENKNSKGKNFTGVSSEILNGTVEQVGLREINTRLKEVFSNPKSNVRAIRTELENLSRFIETRPKKEATAFSYLGKNTKAADIYESIKSENDVMYSMYNTYTDLFKSAFGQEFISQSKTDVKKLIADSLVARSKSDYSTTPSVGSSETLTAVTPSVPTDTPPTEASTASTEVSGYRVKETTKTGTIWEGDSSKVPVNTKGEVVTYGQKAGGYTLEDAKQYSDAIFVLPVSENRKNIPENVIRMPEKRYEELTNVETKEFKEFSTTLAQKIKEGKVVAYGPVKGEVGKYIQTTVPKGKFVQKGTTTPVVNPTATIPVTPATSIVIDTETVPTLTLKNGSKQVRKFDSTFNAASAIQYKDAGFLLINNKEENLPSNAINWNIPERIANEDDATYTTRVEESLATPLAELTKLRKEGKPIVSNGVKNNPIVSKIIQRKLTELDSITKEEQVNTSPIKAIADKIRNNHPFLTDKFSNLKNKDAAKAEKSTQFIGEGIRSTGFYKELFAEHNLANTGKYTKDDKVFVSVNGNRAESFKPIEDGKLQGAYKNLEIAMKEGATLILDNANNRGTPFNTGERVLAEYLSKNGYEETNGDGVWKPSKSNIDFKFLDSVIKVKGTVYGDINPEQAHYLIKQGYEQSKDGLSWKPKKANTDIQEEPKTLNIWYGSNENAELSNRAKRVFSYKGNEFYSVEHAYQSLKTGNLNKFIYENSVWQNNKIIKGKVKPLTKDDYNLNLMEELIYESFKQNPDALKKLLDTGNAKFTHNQDTGIWKNKFPEILEKVRERFKTDKALVEENTTVNKSELDLSKEEIDLLAKDVLNYINVNNPEIDLRSNQLVERLEAAGSEVHRQLDAILRESKVLKNENITLEKVLAALKDREQTNVTKTVIQEAVVNPDILGKASILSNFLSSVNKENPSSLLQVIQNVFTDNKAIDAIKNLLTKEETIAFNTLLKLHEKVKAYLISSIEIPDGKARMFIERNILGMFIRDEFLKEADRLANELNISADEAKYQITDIPMFNDNLAASIAVALFNWYATDAGKTEVMDYDAMINILGYKKRKDAPPNVASFYNEIKHKGTPLNTLRQSLGSSVFSILGFKAKANGDEGTVGKIKVALGTLGFHILQNMDLVEINTIPSLVFNEYAANKREPDSIEEKEVVQFGRLKTEEEIREDGSYNVFTKANQIILATSKLGTKLLRNLFDINNQVRNPLINTLPEPNKEGLVENFQEITPKQIEAANKMQNEPWGIDIERSNGLFNFPRKFIESFVGIKSEEDLYKVSAYTRASKQASNQQLLWEIEDWLSFLNEVPNAATDSIYFPQEPLATGRIQIATNGVNPMNSKIHRHLVYMKQWETNVPAGNSKKTKDIRNAFAYAIAQGFGVKIDQLKKEEVLTKFDELLANPIIQQAIKSLTKIKASKTPITDETDADVLAVNEAMKLGKEKLATYAALDALTYYKKDKPFKTNLFVEFDGKTNGVAIASILFSGFPANTMYLNAKRVGIFLQKRISEVLSEIRQEQEKEGKELDIDPDKKPSSSDTFTTEGGSNFADTVTEGLLDLYQNLVVEVGNVKDQFSELTRLLIASKKDENVKSQFDEKSDQLGKNQNLFLQWNNFQRFNYKTTQEMTRLFGSLFSTDPNDSSKLIISKEIRDLFKPPVMTNVYGIGPSKSSLNWALARFVSVLDKAVASRDDPNQSKFTTDVISLFGKILKKPLLGRVEGSNKFVPVTKENIHLVEFSSTDFEALVSFVEKYYGPLLKAGLNNLYGESIETRDMVTNAFSLSFKVFIEFFNKAKAKKIAEIIEAKMAKLDPNLSKEAKEAYHRYYTYNTSLAKNDIKDITNNLLRFAPMYRGPLTEDIESQKISLLKDLTSFRVFDNVDNAYAYTLELKLRNKEGKNKTYSIRSEKSIYEEPGVAGNPAAAINIDGAISTLQHLEYTSFNMYDADGMGVTNLINELSSRNEVFYKILRDYNYGISMAEMLNRVASNINELALNTKDIEGNERANEVIATLWNDLIKRTIKVNRDKENAEIIETKESLDSFVDRLIKNEKIFTAITHSFFNVEEGLFKFNRDNRKLLAEMLIDRLNNDYIHNNKNPVNALLRIAEAYFLDKGSQQALWVADINHVSQFAAGIGEYSVTKRDSDIAQKNNKKIYSSTRKAIKNIFKEIFENPSAAPFGSQQSSNFNTAGFTQAPEQVTSVTAKEIFERLRTYGAVREDSNFEAYLQDLINQFADKIPENLLLKLRNDAVVTRGMYDPSTNTMYVEATNSANNALTKSAQETYTHELLHSILSYALDNNPEIYAQVKELFDSVKAAINEMAIAQGVEPHMLLLSNITNPTRDDIREAQKIYNYIFANTKNQPKMSKVIGTTVLTKKESSNYLHEFLIYGLTNKRVNNLIQSIDPAKLNKPVKTGFFAKLMNIFNKVLDFIGNSFSKDMSKLTADKRLLELAHALTETNNTWINNLSRASNYINNKADAMVKTAVQTAIVDPVIAAANSRFIRTSRILPVQVVGSFVRGISNAGFGQWAEYMTDALHQLGMQEDGVWLSLIQEIGKPSTLGRKIEALLRHSINAIDTRRKDIAANTARDLMSAFETPLDQVQKEVISDVVIRADIGVLLNKDVQQALNRQYNLNHLLKFSEDSAALRAEISYIQTKLTELYGTNLAHYYKLQSLNLGYYQIFTKNNLHGMNLNPYNIARIKTSTPVSGIPTPPTNIALAENLIDALSTLHALSFIEENDRQTFANILRNEMQRGDENGMVFTIQAHDFYKRSALTKLFHDNKEDMIKGYIKENFDPYTNIKIDRTSNKADLAELGWKDSMDLTPNTAIQGLISTSNKANPKYTIYVHNTSRPSRQRGAISLTAEEFRGTLLNEVHDPNVVKRYETIVERSIRNQFDPSTKWGVTFDNVPVPLGNKYRYMINRNTKQTLLGVKSPFDLIMGKMFAGITDKVETKRVNREIAKILIEDDANYEASKFKTLNINGNSEYDNYFRLMPNDMREALESHFGKTRVRIRTKYLHTLFGFKERNIEDFINDPQFGKVFKGITSLIGVATLGKINRSNVLKAENIWKEIVTKAKDFIVIRSVDVLAYNVISNTLLLWAQGTPLPDIIKNTRIAIVEHERYDYAMRKLDSLQLRLSINPKNRALQVEIAQLKDMIAKNPLSKLIDSGLYPSIVEDIEDVELPGEYESPLDKLVKPLTDRTPQVIKTAANYAFLGHKTDAYKFLRKATQLSDFSARYVMFKHLIEEEGKTEQEAMEDVLDTFVQYDIPTHPQIDYLNKMGIVMFTKYWLRIQRIIWTMVMEHPSRVLTLGLGQSLLGDAPTILDGSIMWNGLGNHLHTPLGIMGGLLEPYPVATALDLL